MVASPEANFANGLMLLGTFSVELVNQQANSAKSPVQDFCEIAQYLLARKLN